MPAINDCIVLHGPELNAHHCRRFSWQGDTLGPIDLGDPITRPDHGMPLIMPGLYNGHTHVGDGALPDGAFGLTLEEGFFRPHGYKYRELAKLDESAFQARLEETLRFMARTGTVAHLDFREQGVAGAEFLRRASAATGVQSIILSQFDTSPFSETELAAKTATLPASAMQELTAMLAIADGFSESTINDLTPPAWNQVRAATTAAGKLRAIHCLENEGYRSLSLARHQRGDLAHALATFDPHLIVHLTAATTEEIALMADSGKTAVLNPRANATLGLNLPPVQPLLDSGTNLLLGTDNVMLNSPNLFAELDFTQRLARSQAGEDRPRSPDAREILRLVTSNIAPVLGGDHYGYLEKGLPASFCVLDFSAPHLRTSRHLHASIVGRVGTADVLATFARGRELWRDERLKIT